MRDVAHAFLLWLIGFGTVSAAILVVLHLVLHQLRHGGRPPRGQPASGDQQGSMNEDSAGAADSAPPFVRRLGFVAAIVVFYAIVLGPLAGDAVSWLRRSSEAGSSGSAAAIQEEPDRRHGASTNDSRHPDSRTTALPELRKHQRNGAAQMTGLIPVPDPISSP